MTVRPAGGDADVDAAVELWRASRAADGRRPSAVQLADLTAALTAPATLLVLADGTGFALGRWSGPDELELIELVVSPAVRRAGAGTALAEGLADAAWAKGARALLAAPPDPRAELFLEACGLQPAGERWRGELEAPVRDLRARLEGLRLGQLLKLAGLVETGAEAKALLAADGVLVNGEPEARRGRQLEAGDVVSARGESVRVLPD